MNEFLALDFENKMNHIKYSSLFIFRPFQNTITLIPFLDFFIMKDYNRIKIQIEF